MTNLYSVLKSRDIILPTKVCPIKTGFSSNHVWMWELDYKESWAPKNDTFELWCWRRLLRVSWIARRSNQSILKEINREYSLEGQMLKLKHQYFGHLIWRANSLERTQMFGKIEGRRKDWREKKKGATEDEMVGWHHQFNGHEFEQTPGDGEGQRSLACCSPWGYKEMDTTWWLNNTQVNLLPWLAEGSFENCFVRPSTERRNRWWMLPPSVILVLAA